MLVSKTVETKWNSRNKKKFVELGYEYTKMGDIFYTSIEDTSKTNKNYIKYKCDFCGEINSKMFGEYLQQRKITPMDCCNDIDCKNKKLEMSVLKKYGETNISKTDYFKEAYKAKMNQNYGVDNYFELLDHTGSNNHEWKDTNYTCTNCGKVEHRKESHINKNGNNFCSMECKAEFYTGEKVEDYKYPRSTKLYREWKDSVHKKYHNKCFICGSQIDIRAHHLEGMSINSSLAFSVNNGITLCDNHHNPSEKGSFHNLYGTYKNTKEQFIEYCGKYHSINYEEKIKKLKLEGREYGNS